MNGRISDEELDELLWREFKLDYRAPDEPFVSRVDRAVLEEERFARAKAAMSRDFTVDLISLAAIVAALVVLSSAPGLREALAGFELWAWGSVLALMLLWLAVRRPVGELF